MHAHRLFRVGGILFGVLFLSLSAAAGEAAKTTAQTPSYLFAYFLGNGEDGLHLAASTDGYQWTALRGGKSFLQPVVGESKLMRDPCLLPGPDGTFHLVWTTSWHGKTIGYASSKDLLKWSAQKAVPVMEAEPKVGNCWAPEVVYDAAARQFVIFWSSTIPGRFPETDNQGDHNHRLYATTTADFEKFTPTKLLFDPGFNCIDATIVQDAGRFVMVFKDERLKPEAKKNLRTAVADSPQGPWKNVSEPFTKSWVEGPTCLRVGDEWLIYFDCYREGKYGAMRTKDFVKFEDVSSRLQVPPKMRHGTAIRVSEEILERLR